MPTDSEKQSFSELSRRSPYKYKKTNMIECTRRVRFFYICMAHFNADFDGSSIKNRVEWKTGCVSDEINR